MRGRKRHKKKYTQSVAGLDAIAKAANACAVRLRRLRQSVGGVRDSLPRPKTENMGDGWMRRDLGPE